MLKIGIVGCGTIATLITKAVISKKLTNSKILAVYDKNLDKSEFLAEVSGAEVCNSVDELVKKDIDIVVESASVKAVEDVVEKSLNHGKDVIVMSVGAFVDKELYIKLRNLAEEKQKRIYIPSGAIAGIDAIKSASLGKIKEVVLTTTKPVEGLKDALKNQRIDFENIKEPTVVFEGDVFDAINNFPMNINVSVILSLASNFPAKVKIVADPNATVNMHEIFVRGSIGTVRTTVENYPCKDNPKTSVLAAYAVIQLIKDLSEPIRIGT